MHKTWPNQHNMTKLQSNMTNVHFFPSMSMGFTNCSSVLNLTRTIVGLPDLSGSPQLIQNVHTSYLIPPKRTCHVFHSSKMCIPFLSFLQNVYTISIIPPKCAFQVFYSSKMYIQVLSLIQNVKLNTTYDHKLYTFQLFGVHHQCLQSFNLIKILKVAKIAIWYFVSIFVSVEQ